MPPHPLNISLSHDDNNTYPNISSNSSDYNFSLKKDSQVPSKNSPAVPPVDYNIK